MPVEVTPIVVDVPTGSLLSNAVRIPLSSRDVLQTCRITRVSGYLAALVSGSFGVDVRDLRDGTLIASLAWSGGGSQSSGFLDYLLDQPDSGLAIAPTSLGVGAQSCVLTIWTLMSF